LIQIRIKKIIVSGFTLLLEILNNYGDELLQNTVMWNEKLDVCPEYLYEKSVKVK
jgi:hypothetical protein